MIGQNEMRFTTLVEDSPVEKMVKRAISSVKDYRDLQRNDDEWRKEQAQRGKALENTALFKQLAEPVIKQKILGAPASGKREHETFGHKISPYEVDSQTWKQTLPNGSDSIAVSKKRAREDKDKEKGDGAAKKRQYKKKAAKVKTTAEVIQEFNLSQAGHMNFELAYMNDPEPLPPSTHQRRSTQFMAGTSGAPEGPASGSGVVVASTSSGFLISPDKSSNHSLYPEYSEEVPQQSLSLHQHQQFMALAPEFVQSPNPSQQQQQQGYITQLQPMRVNQQHPRTVQRPATGNGSFGHLQGMTSSDLVEANLRLLREIAILRLFIKSQKLRIETLCKQNEAYRKTIHQNTFQHELEKIDLIYGTNDDPPSIAEPPSDLWGC